MRTTLVLVMLWLAATTFTQHAALRTATSQQEVIEALSARVDRLHRYQEGSEIRAMASSRALTDWLEEHRGRLEQVEDAAAQLLRDRNGVQPVPDSGGTERDAE